MLLSFTQFESEILVSVFATSTVVSLRLKGANERQYPARIYDVNDRKLIVIMSEDSGLST